MHGKRKISIKPWLKRTKQNEKGLENLVRVVVVSVCCMLISDLGWWRLKLCGIRKESWPHRRNLRPFASKRNYFLSWHSSLNTSRFRQFVCGVTTLFKFSSDFRVLTTPKRPFVSEERKCCSRHENYHVFLTFQVFQLQGLSSKWRTTRSSFRISQQ